MAREVASTIPAKGMEKRHTKTAPRHTGALEHLTKLILLGAPVFYALGRVYAEGYWNALGVSPSVMDVDAEDYIYYGFIVIVNGLSLVLPSANNASLWLAPLASGALLVLLGLGVWLLTKIKAWLAPMLRKVGRRVRVYCANKRSAVQALSTAGSILTAVNSLALGFVLFSAALLVPLVIANSVGKLQAQRVRKDLGESKSSYALVESNSQQRISGRLVDCSGNYCVLFAKGHFTPVSQEGVRWIVDQNSGRP